MDRQPARPIPLAPLSAQEQMDRQPARPIPLALLSVLAMRYQMEFLEH